MTVRIQTRTGEPPTGVVMADGQQPARFAGWLDLMSTIEQMANTAAAAHDVAAGDVAPKRSDAEDR